MASELFALAQNPAVTSDALRIIAYVMSLGRGEHEIPADTFRMLLRCRDDRPVYQARECAERFGLRWKRGGRAHNNTYEWTGLPDDSAPVLTQAPIRVSTNAESSTRLRSTADTNGDVGEEGVTTGRGSRDAREGEVEYPLSPKAQLAIVEYGEKFTGFRGALTDYLQTRVHPDRQYGYIQSVATWLDGGDPAVSFRDATGSRAPPEKIAGIIASALNELLGADENKMARPVGDPGNLKTKIGIISGGRNGNYSRRTGGAGGGKAAASGGGTSIGANQPEHTWER